MGFLTKSLHKRYTKSLKDDKPGFNITKLLLNAYNNIESSGTVKAKLLEGWLCPIYKKKD